MTEISLEDFHAPATEAGLVLATEVDASIAPWVDIPPTPPPKPKKASFAFPRSPSFDKNPLAILTRLRPSRSKARLLPPPDPALESYVSFHNGLPPVPALPFPKRASADRKARPLPQQPQSPQPQHPEIFLDRNLDDMEGIIDLTALPPHSQDGASGSSHSDPFASVASFAPFDSPPAPLFTTANPFSPSPVPAAPRRRPSVPTLDPLASLRSANGEPPDDPSWKPPQSWGFVKNGDDDEQGEPAYSSSSDESALSPTATAPVRRRTRRRPPPAAAAPAPDVPYAIRIYRANNTYHVAAIALHTTVAELVPVLNTKLLSDAERETHRLYLKERGRERVLAHTERPADIVRRRLEQAGYDAADGLDKLGAEDMPFLLKFMYKSQLLGKAEGELNLEAFEYVDLTGRGLRTVPVVLHSHADTIVSLTLSRNPMLEIPLDFVQSCTTLRELRLSNMAMQRVPHSVRHSTALFRLDLSCNRIADLGGAGLDALAELSKLNLRNNRLAALPPDFARLRHLRALNISNNRLRRLPGVLGDVRSLMDLDVSFNLLAELPPELGRLAHLETFILVGNRVARLPDELGGLVSLKVLDCRRNAIADLAPAARLPGLRALHADHNAVHALDLTLGPRLQTLGAAHNDVTRLTLLPPPRAPRAPAPPLDAFALTCLDLSHAKLSALDDAALGQLASLETLRLDHNAFRALPDSLCALVWLEHLSCADNLLTALPPGIGGLQNLRALDAHSNSLKALPAGLWLCGKLALLNATSNLLDVWEDPPPLPPPATPAASASRESLFESAWSSIASSPVEPPAPPARALPPLAHSLQRLYLGENRLTDDALHPLTLLKELRVLNLSFNDIQELAPAFFRGLAGLEELYLSGNKLSSLPTEDLHKMRSLALLFLNGNRLQTLPQELARIPRLRVLDVGSNNLRYNIYNWKFDWNWNFNPDLIYLNLSGNKKLEIKSEANVHKALGRSGLGAQHEDVLADFSRLTRLRVLGLMDVTTTFVAVPEETDERRVRTSLSEVNGMAYGIADTLGRDAIGGKVDHGYMLDLVQPAFRGRADEAVFAMFGQSKGISNNNRLSRILRDKLLPTLQHQVDQVNWDAGEGVQDALRRTFLRLNKALYDELYLIASSNRKMSQASTASVNTAAPDLTTTITGGASGIVAYIVGKTLYVANVGNALAVVSRQGTAEALATKHDPFGRGETARIRAAEGWVSPKGLVNEEVDVARSFGFFNLAPVVSARPDVRACALSPRDEFVIIGNRGLWDYVSFQTAVDIARAERSDPMIAAQKLRDFAISYGAEGSTMIMVICVADLFGAREPAAGEGAADADGGALGKRRRRLDNIADRSIARLDDEPAPPTGHVALVFTDIRNSTHLWEVNAGMPTAMRIHNSLLRRQLRFCRGYEVKTEGDAFMCSFPSVLSALWWCAAVQLQLLHEEWPLEILECGDGKEVRDAQGALIARGLSVRMGIHCGAPVCERDPVTDRMDYFGPMVNRTARINSSAAGGQIMCSAEVAREIAARVLGDAPEPATVADPQQPQQEQEQEQPQPQSQPPPPLPQEQEQAVDAVRRMGIVVVPVGEVRLKGLETPETLSLVYPRALAGRQELDGRDTGAPAARSRVQFSGAQMRELGVLCLRLEALAAQRIFRPQGDGGGDAPHAELALRGEEGAPVFTHCDPQLLLPPMSEKSTDKELMVLLDSLTGRIENAMGRIYMHHLRQRSPGLVEALRRPIDERTLEQLLTLLQES